MAIDQIRESLSQALGRDPTDQEVRAEMRRRIAGLGYRFGNNVEYLDLERVAVARMPAIAPEDAQGRRQEIEIRDVLRDRILDIGFMIDLALPKMHGEYGYTGAAKNLMGLLTQPSREVLMHNSNLTGRERDVNLARLIDYYREAGHDKRALFILDGGHVLTRHEQFGEPVNSDFVFIGEDPVALDDMALNKISVAKLPNPDPRRESLKASDMGYLKETGFFTSRWDSEKSDYVYDANFRAALPRNAPANATGQPTVYRTGLSLLARYATAPVTLQKLMGPVYYPEGSDPARGEISTLQNIVDVGAEEAICATIEGWVRTGDPRAFQRSHAARVAVEEQDERVSGARGALGRMAREVSSAFLSEHFDRLRYRDRPTVFKGRDGGDRESTSRQVCPRHRNRHPPA
jgi:hypothetical protein